jgi:hypothetical protein
METKLAPGEQPGSLTLVSRYKDWKLSNIRGRHWEGRGVGK